MAFLPFLVEIFSDYNNINRSAYFWLSTEASDSTAFEVEIYRDKIGPWYKKKTLKFIGQSVRCLKD